MKKPSNERKIIYVNHIDGKARERERENLIENSSQMKKKKRKKMKMGKR
jgi:hypothetical protein